MKLFSKVKKGFCLKLKPTASSMNMSMFSVKFEVNKKHECPRRRFYKCYSSMHMLSLYILYNLRWTIERLTSEVGTICKYENDKKNY